MDKGIIMAWKLKPDVPDNADENLIEKGVRVGLSNTARLTEGFLGAPAALLEFGVNAISSATGGRTPTHEQLTEKDKKRGVPSILQLPTPERLREGTKALTGEYLEPKSNTEATGNAISQLVGGLLSGPKGLAELNSLSKVGKTISQIPKTAARAGAAFGGAKVVESLGGGKGAQEATKIGILLASGFPGVRDFLEKRAKDAFNFTKSVPETITHKVPKLESLLSDLQKETEVGHLSEDKKALQEFIQSVENSIGKGTKQVYENGRSVVKRAIPIKEMVQLEKDANKLLRNASYPKEAKAPLGKIKEELESSLKDYGKTNKPWLEAYEESKDIYRGLKTRSKLNAFLQDNINLSELMKSKIAKTVLFPGTIASSLISPTGTAIGAGAYGTGMIIREAVKFAEFFYHSAFARKYYVEALQAAVNGNTNAFVQSAKRLDKEAEKYEKKHPDKGKWKLKS